MSTVNPTTFPDSGSTGQVCIANISTAERRKRLRFGVIMFVVSLAILVVLMLTGVSRWWRLPLFLLFAAATTGYFQWHDKTCVALAAKQTRKIGDTEEKIEDAAELAQIGRQARKVQIKALVAAIPLTLIALALPLL
jgi:Ca2+/Na+ antiporter